MISMNIQEGRISEVLCYAYWFVITSCWELNLFYLVGSCEDICQRCLDGFWTGCPNIVPVAGIVVMNGALCCYNKCRYARPKKITSLATPKNHLKWKYGYRHFQNNIVCCCNVNTNKVMGIWNETKNVIHFQKITISLKNWHFLTCFTQQDPITPGQILAIAEVLCVIVIPF